MSNDIEGIIKTTLENINSITENEKLISSNINYDNSNFLAISKLNLNFVIGGSDLDKEYKHIDVKPFAGACYVNLSLTPQMLIYEENHHIQSISLSGAVESGGIGAAIGNMIEYIREIRNKNNSRE